MEIKVTVYEYSAKRKGLIFQCGDRFGEAAPLPGFSPESFEVLRKKSLALFEGHWDALPPSLVFALQSLLLPRCAINDIPLTGLYGNGGRFEKYKLKLKGKTLQQALTLIQKARSESHAPLRLDCNRSWTKKNVTALLSEVPKASIEYIEEPCARLEETLSLSEATEVPIAFDESLPFLDETMLLANAIAVLKPTILGDITRFFHLPFSRFVLSSAYESGIGMRALLNLAQFPQIEARFAGLDTYSPEEDIASPQLIFSNGTSGDAGWNVRLNASLKKIQAGSLIVPKQIATAMERSKR